MLFNAAASVIDKVGRKGAVCSLAPATTSALLFGVCELYLGTSSERTRQLLAAAIVLAVLAAVHTHAVLGGSITGWRYVMPFQGGLQFMRLQALGWVLFALVLFFGFYIMAGLCAICVPVSGMPSLLGFVQFVAQISLVASLSQFDTSDVYGLRCTCATRARGIWTQGNHHGRTTAQWRRDGVPLLVVLSSATFAGIMVCIAIYSSQCPARAAGQTTLLLLLLAHAFGVHLMWTLTWNILCICALLLQSEKFLAVTACIGFAHVCIPWYAGQLLYKRIDLPNRALFGICKWMCDDLFNIPGFYPTEICYRRTFMGYWFVDQSLHILPSMMLLQLCAHNVTVLSALEAAAIALCWFVTVSLKHKVVDWPAFRDGRLRYLRWGNVSLYEPRKVGQIYLFENSLYEDDGFMTAVPGLLGLFFAGTLIMCGIAALPCSASLITVLGGGPLLSIRSLGFVTCVSAVTGAVLILSAAATTFLSFLRSQRKAA